ncbi:MAG: RNA-binding protein [Candidatus Hecatellales archaeon]|nr:MAG: RNA-binding protein [Candidatus Hecatellales archaeon]
MSITPQTEPLTKIKSRQMIEFLKSGKRLDGRTLTQHRNVKIEAGVIGKAEGSAQVTLGNTRVLVGVKIETGPPYSDTPNMGVLTVNAELLPLAHEVFEPGPPDENSIELARVVDRSIRESKALDLESLVIIPAKLAYVVFVDIYILNHDGNLFDASEYAAISALLNAKLPVVKVEGEEVKPTGEFKELPVRECPISVTIAKVDEALLVDPTLEEEVMASAKITITTTSTGKICAIQKSGGGAFTPQEILEAQRIARSKAEEIRSLIPGWGGRCG